MSPVLDFPALTNRPAMICDTTLRDGEQTAGVAFTLEEKLAIALALDEAHVTEIELGVAAMGPEEVAEIRAIAQELRHAEPVVWCRLRMADLDAAQYTGVRRLHFAVPTSERQLVGKLKADRNWALRETAALVYTATTRGFAVSVGAEDASRADLEFLVELARVAKAAGAIRFRLADTLGLMSPFTAHALVAKLAPQIDLPLEFHAHNDFGMATANTLAAYQAGADHLSVTVNGLGERAGNAALEEVSAALDAEGIPTGVDLRRLMALSLLVAHASGRPLPANKPIVGEYVFSHEAGIHVDAILKNRNTYQDPRVDPARFGRSHRLTVGKHSGMSGLQAALAANHLPSDTETVRRVLPLLRGWANAAKREAQPEDLVSLVSIAWSIEEAEARSRAS
ncbi:homocitrate synthase [Poseidonocella sp. HB161398]|uniref:homocitrate synthase n=1 Tax=Poseidonocella sp. HB161398 TaxID=2320855 RepID=UPI001109BB0E|nr:homocitrate synthase [Poseidonocella sp. HB161398]